MHESKQQQQYYIFQFQFVSLVNVLYYTTHLCFLFLASFLAERSWRGLEQKLGETPVVKAVGGRRGIAIAYEEEGTAPS